EDEAVFLVAHHQRRLHAFEGQALEGLLEQRVLAGQGQELLGIQLAGKGPESRAATTGKNDGNHVGFLLKAFMRSVGRRAPLPFRVTSPCGPSWQLAGFFLPVWPVFLWCSFG